MLNRTILTSSITLFSKYSKLKDCDSFDESYEGKVMPTFIEHCNLSSKNNYNVSKVGNMSKGDYSATFSFEQSATVAYRYIDGKKVYLKYIDESLYSTKTYQQQLYKYFTLNKSFVFASSLLTELKTSDSNILSVEEFNLITESKNIKLYSIENIEQVDGSSVVKISGKII